MTDLVIFDCDGVLVDSEGPANAVLDANLGRYGLHLTSAACQSLFIGGTMASVEADLRARGVDLPQTWLAEIYDQIYARLKQGVDPVPGVIDLLNRLDHAGIPYCVASNGAEEKMRITLGQTGMWDRFQGAMFSARTLGVAKPDPALFLTAARQMGADPARCVVIEDSLTGVTAARRAGMRCLAYTPNGDDPRMIALGAEGLRRMADAQPMLGLP